MNNRQGFTLLEVMIVIAIFGIILIAVNLVYLSGTKTYRHSTQLAQMRLRTSRIIYDISAELADCQLVSGENLLDRIEYQKPTPKILDPEQPDIRVYIDGSTSDPYWGDGIPEVTGSPEVHISNTITMDFVPTSTVKESDDQIDYNQDDDLSDEYVKGRIVKRVWADGVDKGSSPPLSETLMSHDWVFRPAYPPPGPPYASPVWTLMDIDGRDGPDPVFLIVDNDGNPNPAGGRIQVRVFTMEMINGRPVLITNSTVVTSVNLLN